MLDEEKNETGLCEPEENEVTLWYSRKDEAQEVVHCYVQPTPMPGAVPPQPEKKRRRGLWIFLICLAALLLVVGIVGWSTGIFNPSNAEVPEEEEDASSIIDIFRSGEKTTIPRCQGDAEVRMTCAEEAGEKLTAQEVYAKVNPSVVVVAATKGESASVGTGIIMTEDGYIITNAHVISGCEDCFVALYSGMTYDVKLVGMDTSEDIAVLKADAEDLVAAEFGNSDLAEVGETVYAIGNPLGIKLRGTLTNGILSAINRDMTVDGKTMTLLQTNAAINNGNSGGPLINESGQIIGINTLKMGNIEELDATVEGLGFAIPSTTVYYVVNDLIAKGEFEGIPTLGVTIGNYQTANGSVLVVVECEGAQKHQADVQPGDIIEAVNGQPVTETSELLAIKRACQVGDTMTLTLYRDGESFDVEFTLYADKK